MAAALYNKIDKKILKERIKNDPTPRTTVSFYKYVNIADVNKFRDDLYRDLDNLGCLGRIYIAKEGINAQMNVPTKNWDEFQSLLDSYDYLSSVPLKIAVEQDNTSFYKLKIKVRPKVLADGLDDETFNPWDTGKHLKAKEFNEAIENGAIVVDMRNHYESEVGHFVNAIKPDCDTFRDELAMVESILQGKEDQKILMYCTGGIRCEKASAYFKHKGFKDVNQLEGGIISYAHQVQQEGLKSMYLGKNFVFDERLGERITDDILAHCHQCGEPCDDHTNCANADCHLLFIQCPSCKEKLLNCCSDDCLEEIKLPEEIQREHRKGKKKEDAQNIFKKGRITQKIKLNKSNNT